MKTGCASSRCRCILGHIAGKDVSSYDFLCLQLHSPPSRMYLIEREQPIISICSSSFAAFGSAWLADSKKSLELSLRCERRVEQCSQRGCAGSGNVVRCFEPNVARIVEPSYMDGKKRKGSCRTPPDTRWIRIIGYLHVNYASPEPI
jgi:hypothetical protein